MNLEKFSLCSFQKDTMYSGFLTLPSSNLDNGFTTGSFGVGVAFVAVAISLQFGSSRALWMYFGVHISCHLFREGSFTTVYKIVILENLIFFLFCVNLKRPFI